MSKTNIFSVRIVHLTKIIENKYCFRRIIHFDIRQRTNLNLELLEKESFCFGGTRSPKRNSFLYKTAQLPIDSPI